MFNYVKVNKKVLLQETTHDITCHTLVGRVGGTESWPEVGVEGGQRYQSPDQDIALLLRRTWEKRLSYPILPPPVE